MIVRKDLIGGKKGCNAYRRPPDELEEPRDELPDERLPALPDDTPLLLEPEEVFLEGLELMAGRELG